MDGQQRSQTVYDFFHDKLKISAPKSRFAGKKFSQLEEEEKQKFIEYELSIDTFSGATEQDIREIFRRINSYNVPLKPQEKRHAIYQGEFKWFIVELSDKYAQLLKQIGVVSEKDLSRMLDAKLFTEIIMAMQEGIQTASEPKLDSFYAAYDKTFEEREISKQLDQAFEYIIRWETIHGTALMKPYNFYALMLAILHHLKPLPKLMEVYPLEPANNFDDDIVLANLGDLIEALEQPANNSKKYRDFVVACSATTNQINQRVTRFKHFCDALQAELV